MERVQEAREGKVDHEALHGAGGGGASAARARLPWLRALGWRQREDSPARAVTGIRVVPKGRPVMRGHVGWWRRGPAPEAPAGNAVDAVVVEMKGGKKQQASKLLSTAWARS